ncbi:hypothetical protein O3P69_016866 [Scylla paramamosain]|uniref:Secreted protein n=1 Tax=Scylla paramamosain TaxID=85552 RepID=A0AAW0T2S8_SCYPA
MLLALVTLWHGSVNEDPGMCATTNQRFITKLSINTWREREVAASRYTTLVLPVRCLVYKSCPLSVGTKL